MQQQKVLGAPCTVCGSPYEQGQKGVYCKPCYINWAKANKPQGQQNAQTVAYTPNAQQNVTQANSTPNNVQSAEDREQSMRWMNALNNASLVVAHDADTVDKQTAIKTLAEFIYTLKRPVTIENSQGDEIVIDQIPFN